MTWPKCILWKYIGESLIRLKLLCCIYLPKTYSALRLHLPKLCNLIPFSFIVSASDCLDRPDHFHIFSQCNIWTRNWEMSESPRRAYWKGIVVVVEATQRRFTLTLICYWLVVVFWWPPRNYIYSYSYLSWYISLKYLKWTSYNCLQHNMSLISPSPRSPCYVFVCICLLTNNYQKYKSVELGD